MDLKQHKALIRSYEDALLELRALKNARPGTVWLATARLIDQNGEYCAELPIPTDYAATLLKERIWALEDQAKEMARTLGIEYDEQV